MIPQLERKNKESVFVDRRFGEDNPNMTVEEKMMERFVRERQRKARTNASLFNLDAEENQDLTHYGQSLGDLQDYSDEDARLMDDYESDEEFKGQIDKKSVQRTHFGGFESDEERSNDKPKTRAEIMKEVIAKSKAHKAERQRVRDENETIRKQLDADLDDVRALILSSQQNTTVLPEKDDYDVMVKSLAQERRAQPTDRLKTDNELAQHQKEELEKLEAQRQQRMLGIVEEKTDKSRKRKAEGDDLETNIALDEEETAPLTYKDGELVNDTIFVKRRKTSTESRESGEESEESEEASEDGQSGDNSEADESGEESEEGSEEQLGEGESDEDSPLAPVQPRLSKEEIEKITAEARKELPFVIGMPEDPEGFSRLMLDRTPEQVGTILSRLQILHSTKIHPQNKEKLVQLFHLCLGHVGDIVERCENVNDALGSIAVLTHHLVNLAKESPTDAAGSCLDYIVRLQNQFTKRLGRSNALSSADLLTLQVICRIFPTSDYQHPVSTPLIMFVEQILATTTISSLDDCLKSLFLVSLSLDFVKLSKRYVPEAISFLYSVLLSVSNSKQSFGCYPGPETRKFTWEDHASKHTSALELNLAWLLNGECNVDGEHMRALLYVHALEQLCQFAQLYAQDTNLTSFVEVFTPALSIESADSSLGLKPWKRRLSEVHSSLDRNIRHQAMSRTALELQKHRAVPIATHLPRFEENYSIDRAKYGMDPNRDRAETKKVSRQYKKEFKGAVRELRKDTRFVAKHQLQKTREKDQLYQSKIRSIVGELSREQGEANVAERQKGKADRKKREQKK